MKRKRLFDNTHDLFPEGTPKRGPAPNQDTCILCGAITLVHRRYAAVCGGCSSDAPAKLDALEMGMVEAEERIVAAHWRFDTILQHAKQSDRDRYQQVCEARIDAVLDDGQWDALKRRIAKTIAQSDGLSAILKADAECDAACTEAGDSIARIRDQQVALIGFAPDWTIPDAINQRRNAISGQRSELATFQVALAL